MKTPRWLLPFTHGMDMHAIDYAVRLADSAGATLVPVSLISAQPTEARLEPILQSQDFLEAVKYKAERFQVPVERYEVFTTDMQQSLTTLVQEMRCDGIIVVSSSEHTCLLLDEEVKPLLLDPPASLVLIRLAASSRLALASSLRASFFSRWHALWGQRDSTVQAQVASVVKEPLWIRTEQHHLG